MQPLTASALNYEAGGDPRRRSPVRTRGRRRGRHQYRARIGCGSVRDKLVSLPSDNSTRDCDMMLSIEPQIRSSLDPDFLPAASWNRAYRELVATDPRSRPLTIV